MKYHRELGIRANVCNLMNTRISRVVNIEVSNIPNTLSPILFSTDEDIVNTFEKSIDRGIANTFWPKKSIPYTDAFFLYCIGFNGLPQFTAVERLFTL